ncbi:hypothetical protein [Pseudoalteromonas holothuriae]|nr:MULTISPECIES: hypothetical protein [unclassified Pseudoalteromonas]
MYDFTSQLSNNSKYLRLDGLQTGWYFVSVLGGSNYGTTIEVDIK